MKKELFIQKLIGLGLIVLSALIILFALKFTEDKDATAVFFTIPVGIALLFSKNVWIG